MGFGILDFGGNDSSPEVSPEVLFPPSTQPGSAELRAPETGTQPQDIESLLPVASQNSGYTLDEQQNIFVYDTRNEAVVNITTEEVGYNWFLEPVPREGSSGSGSIIDSRGYILTNNHVVENAYKVNVVLADGEQFDGEVIGSDPENDLAVIRFDPGGHPLSTIPFGTSKGLRVGQKVLAIGNPFAFERTLTTGIISGLGRPLRNDRGIVIQDLIQTDASINPGNSGGPLLNTSGELVGVNTMIYTPSGGSVGIGFAVPVDTARRVVPDLIQHGYVERGWIQIEPVQLFPSLVRFAEMPVSQGILVSQVLNKGNADQAGIRGGSRDKAVRSGNSVIYLGGDIITGINGEKVATLGDLYAALEKSRPGDVVNVSILRGRRQMTMPVTLAERPRERR
ncbi:MAG: peptidase S1 [Spirochaetales bacterium]|nr:MAG: peptidase S1 [Spirochaetales bacterium]